jgi:hypothetical protein
MSCKPKLNLAPPKIRGQDPEGAYRDGVKILSVPGGFFCGIVPATLGRIFLDDLCTLASATRPALRAESQTPRRTPYALSLSLCLPIMYGLPWFTRGNLLA